MVQPNHYGELERPIKGTSIANLLSRYRPQEEFTISYFRVLSSTQDNELAEIWNTIDDNQLRPYTNEKLCRVFSKIDQFIDLYIEKTTDNQIYLEIEDGDLIENKL